MRYFLISFNCERGFGELHFKINGFFKKKDFLKYVSEKHKVNEESIIILNIYEFKNKKDYSMFIGDK